MKGGINSTYYRRIKRGLTPAEALGIVEESTPIDAVDD